MFGKIKNFKSMRNLRLLIKSYEYLLLTYFGIHDGYSDTPGFVTYFHGNSDIPSLVDASTKDGITVGAAVTKDTFSQVPLEENIEVVLKKTT